MNEEIYDGGSAFPPHPNMPMGIGQGMSLRDWFAGMALAGFISNNKQYEFLEMDHIGELAFAFADVMLKQRRLKHV